MLNPKAMSAAGGAGLAAYLWKEAVGLTEEAVADQIQLEDRERYDARVQGLLVALDAAGEKQYRQSIEKLLDAQDPETFARITENMGIVFRAVGQTEWAEAIDSIVEVREIMLDFAELSREVDRRLSQTMGVEYRPDTAPELARLLKLDMDTIPRLQDLKNLLSAKTADGQRIEGRFYRRDREDQITMGSLELIFSSDKSVSVVFGLASPEERAAIAAAQSRAVDKAMRQIGDKIGVIRSRRGGLDRRDPADLTWIQWQHRMSRLGDPQLHTHVSLLNVVRSRVDGKVGTLDTFLLHGLYPSVRETYHRALADELRKLDLPVQFDPKVPAAILTAVPEQLLRHFSGRTEDAEKWLREKHGVGFDSLTPHQRSTWLGHAAAKTRPSKAVHYVPGNGHAAWHARAAGQGYVPPPQFISPQALQRAGIVHATVQQHSQTQPTTPAEQPDRVAKADKRRRSKGINPKTDGRYNRGGGRYEEEARGQRL
jgi:conjugative relaxase-like TrwC/TraI family protein